MADRQNGTGSIAFPVKTTAIALDAIGYVGWRAIVRVNPRSSLYDQLLSVQGDQWWPVFRQVVLEWNFVDEDGRPLPQPSEVASEKDLDLPVGVVVFLFTRYIESVEAAFKVPKEPDSNSSATFKTSAGNPESA